MKWEALVAQLANRINQPHVIDMYMRKVFIAGINKGKRDTLSLPLAERLTEEESEKIRNIYHECELIEMDDSPNLPAYKIEQAGTKMALLEFIFGADFFKEEEE